MHIHGGPFVIVETDGYPVPEGARLLKDTVLVGAGERYDVIWEALRPGKWLLHCHIPHHTTNDNTEIEGGGGLMTVIEVTTKQASAGTSPWRIAFRSYSAACKRDKA